MNNRPPVHNVIKPAPEALSRRGLLRVTTNAAGAEVILPAGTLTRFFGPELVQRLARRRLEVRHAAD